LRDIEKKTAAEEIGPGLAALILLLLIDSSLKIKAFQENKTVTTAGQQLEYNLLTIGSHTHHTRYKE